MEYSEFYEWLKENKGYSEKTLSDILSRLKRANNILNWYNELVYIFMLEQQDNYKKLSTSVRSQIKKAVKLYFEYINCDRQENYK